MGGIGSPGLATNDGPNTPQWKEGGMAKTASGKHRSAVTGQYVKKEYAEKHPKTTITEHDKKKPAPKKKK
jgi:hypothetical protein